jgi:hypothetical protein
MWEQGELAKWVDQATGSDVDIVASASEASLLSNWTPQYVCKQK